MNWPSDGRRRITWWCEIVHLEVFCLLLLSGAILHNVNGTRSAEERKMCYFSCFYPCESLRLTWQDALKPFHTCTNFRIFFFFLINPGGLYFTPVHTVVVNINTRPNRTTKRRLSDRKCIKCFLQARQRACVSKHIVANHLAAILWRHLVERCETAIVNSIFTVRQY